MEEREVAASQPNAGPAGARRIALLSDEPSSTDDFAGKGHEAVATSIAEIVENENGGRVIGLEGSWGAGKSTILRLLVTRLTSDTDAKPTPTETKVIVFDAWSHQGDPLRRTFLEKLIAELDTAGWLASEEAQSQLSRLTGKVSTVTTESTPSLSFEGKVTAIPAALVPAGLALFA